MSRAQLLKHGAWSTVEYIAYPAIMFLAAPYFIHFLGIDAYGQWMSLIALSSIGGLASFGMGAATTKEVSEQLGLNRLGGIDKIVCNSLSIAILGGFIMSLLICLGYALSPSSWTDKLGIRSDINLVIGCTAIIILLEQCESIYVGVMRGYERFDLSAGIEVTSKVTSVILYLMCAWFYRDITKLLYAVVICSVLRLAAKALAVFFLMGATVVKPNWDVLIIKKLFKFGKWTWVQTLSGSIFVSFDRLLIGSALGAGLLARYSLMMQLAQQVHSIPSAAATTLFPMISRMRASGESIIKVFWFAIFITSLIVLAISLPLAFYSGKILELWVPSIMTFGDDRVLELLILAYIILGINIVPHYVLMGFGRVSVVAIANLVAGVLSILVCALTLESSGLISGAWAKLTYSGIVLAFFILFAIRESSSKFFKFHKC